MGMNLLNASFFFFSAYDAIMLSNYLHSYEN